MKKNVILTVYEQHLNSLEAIAEKLRADGLHVKRLYTYGIIIGEIEEQHIEQLSIHPEIESCSEEKKIQLPPSDSDIQ